MTRNPYRSEDNTVISFSGGRTSGFMLYKVLEAYKFKLPENIKVLFANTGKEMPETLDFVKRCSDEWGVEIVWLERRSRRATEEEKNKFVYTTMVVDYKSASRNGAPFLELIATRGYAPNPVARFCTVDLKVRAISEYVKNVCGWEGRYTGLIGIRADEMRRASKMHGTVESNQERYLPLYLEGITKDDICKFWEESSFDLQLPNNRGTTDWGNCDLCFLKGLKKKLSIIRERPDLADWWIKAEKQLSENVGKGAFFRNDHPSYKSMKVIATDQQSLDFFGDDETIPCFCGD